MLALEKQGREASVPSPPPPPALLLAPLSCEESQPPAPSSVNSAMPSHLAGHDHLKPEAKLKLSSQMLSFAT